VSLLDRPGALLSVAKVVADLGGNIVDIEIMATGDGRVIDDLVVDLPSDDRDELMKLVAGTGAEVLDIRRTVQLSGQRPDLDLLARIVAKPDDAIATMLSLSPPIWSADWAAVVGVDGQGTATRTSPGAPNPLPDALPVPIGPLPRRGVVDGAGGMGGTRWEVVGVPWLEGHLYLGRADGPMFLQVEVLQLRRIVELAVALVGERH